MIETAEPVALIEAPPLAKRAPAEPDTRDLKARVQKLRIGGPSQRGKSFLSGVSWLPWILCAVLALAWGGVGMRSYRATPSDVDSGPVVSTGNNSTGSSTKSSSGGTSSTSSIAIAPVKGYLVPAQQIAVSPIDVGGQLIEHNFVEGKQYTKGTVLARIDPTNYNAAVEESKSLVSAAESRLAAANQRYQEILPNSVTPRERNQAQAKKDDAEILEKRAKQEYERLKGLNNSSAIAPREFQQAEADYYSAKARATEAGATLEILVLGPRPEKIAAVKEDFNAAQKDLDASRARLSQAQWRVDNCTIRMPITGTVLSKKAELYSLVNPLAFGATSGSLADIADLSKLEVDLEIPEKDIGKIKEGQLCRIVADAFQERSYDGELFRIMPIANRSKSIISVRVRVILPAGEVQGQFLKPEMGAVVTFLSTPAK